MPQEIDHLVYAAPDLDRAVEDLARRLGVRATVGGRHPGRGTRNALIALGPASYLEIIGPDPSQPAPSAPRWFGIDTLRSARLAAWAAKRADLDRVVAGAAARGVVLGAVAWGSRRLPDGATLEWRFTDPAVVVLEGIAPFFIDWGDGPHPASSAAGGASLVGLRAEHPEPEHAGRILGDLDVRLPVTRAARPSLVATLRTPAGEIELR